VVKFYQVVKTALSGIVRTRGRFQPVDRDVVHEILSHGGAGVMFLVDEDHFHHRYVHQEDDPLSILLELQGRTAGAIAIAPMMILYDRTPKRSIRPFWESLLGDPDRPGALRRLVSAFRKWTVPELLLGEPIQLIDRLEEFGADVAWDELPFELRKNLIANIDARIRVNRGPEKLTSAEIKERVLRDEKVQEAVRAAAALEGPSQEAIRRKAERYVDEIAADQRIQMIHFYYYLLKWIFSNVFDGIDVKDGQFAELKSAAQKGPIVFIPCHKSHFDYLVVPYFTFVNQMVVPHIAAGKNLSFWPLGRLLRGGGGFFIRRSFKGQDLYTAVFASYVKVLLREGFNLKFYMEGGRSRIGRLLAPRLGMLAFVAQAVEEGAVEDLTFAPTFMGYERVPEERSYLQELSGFDKKKESFLDLVRAHEVLKKRYGKVYVRFDSLVSYRDFCSRRSKMLATGGDSGAGDAALVRDLAYHLMSGIVRAGVVAPTELAAGAIIAVGDNRIEHGRLLRCAYCLADCLINQGIELAGRLQPLESGMDAALSLFGQWGFLKLEAPEGPPGERTYLIDQQKKTNLEFYQNQLVNYLWAPAILAALLLEQRPIPSEVSDQMRREFKDFKQLLSRELMVDPLADDEQIIDRAAAFFRTKNWIGSAAGIAANDDSIEPLKQLRSFVCQLLEAYYLVLVTTEDLRESVSQKEFVKRMAKKAAELDVSCCASDGFRLSAVIAANALIRFDEMGVLDYNAERKTVEKVINAEERDRLRRRIALVLGRGAYRP
jgi:glycerol-3-phosphate O-acyltransferase